MKRILLSISLSILCLSAFSQAIESGKVYRIKNIGKPGVNMTAAANGVGAGGANANVDDLKQQWYLKADESNTGFYFRNVNTGAYLTSPKALYTQWELSFVNLPNDDSMLMSVSDYEGNKVIRAKSHTSGSYAFAHCDGSNSIVCWLTSSTPSQWQFEEVPYTETEINAMLSRFKATGDEIAKASIYQNYLSALFNDKACTDLKVSGDLSSNINYTSLPTTLKNMVDKIKVNNWAEADGDWDDEHARKYRVQLYEPYSEGSAAAGMAGIQAYTNMNNPTGIIANAGEMLYVMVENAPKDGATLYLGAVPDCSMYNSVTSGTQLKEGLNMILCTSDVTHYFVYYTVNTVKDKKPVAGRELNNYDAIKIHIEGGRVNGFFDYVGDSLYKPDTKEDFEYTTQRARHPMFDLIGKYVILHFYLEDTPDQPGQAAQVCVKNAFKNNPGKKHDDPVLTMQAWDKMCFAERILMGLQSDDDIDNPFNEGMYETIVGKTFNKGGYDATLNFHYSDYFNNKMMGLTYQAAGLYMNATSWRTAYAPSTLGAILSQFPEDGIWGPAHEYGHMNQGPICIAGTTEESNNIFSNVANYFLCKTTSRCDYPSQQIKNFNAGNTYLDNETWGTTRMYWQLWCYYHYCGKNKQFYPRLYELLRRYPLERETTTYGGKLNAKKDLLHFAKMASLAAGEDLTNFFASWGFFSPQESYHIDDYSIYDMIVTQQDIDAVKEEIKSWGFEKNDAIILIDDRVNSSLPAGFGYNKDQCGEYGSLDDFKNGNISNGSFEFTIDGNNVSVTGGKPGTGYLIYDEEGNLIGFSNSDNFTLSNDAAKALTNGTASIKAVDSENNMAEVVDPVKEGSIDKKKELLKKLIDTTDALLAKADESLTHVGMIYPEKCTPLKEKREHAYALWENPASNSDDFTNEYMALSATYYELLNDESARIPVEAGSAYRLINHNYTNRALDADDQYCGSTTFNAANSMVPFGQQWILEPVVEGSIEAFYIKNLASGKYIGTTKKQSTNIPLTDTPQSYTFITIEPGVYSFAPDNETKYGIHIDAGNKVVQWNTTSTPTQWSLVKTSTPEIMALRNEISALVSQTREKLATCGLMERLKPVNYQFSEENVYSNAKYTGGGSDNFTTWSVLFDNNLNTYFHSNYNNSIDSDDGLDHYIRLKAPGNESFRFLELSYTTRNATSTATNPRSIVIEASRDASVWKEIFHASGLPTGPAVSYSTGEIIAPEDTQFIRMMVTGSGGTAKGHPYFVLSELNVSNLGEPKFTPDENFPYLTSEAMQELYDALIDATFDMNDSSSSATTLKEKSQALEAALKTVDSLMIPKVDINSITIPVSQVVLKMESEPVKVNATIDPEDATFPEFEWAVEDSSIAEIRATEGKTVELSPIAMGETTLSVTVKGNPLVTASVPVKVLPAVPVEALALVPGDITVPLNAGEFTLSYETYPENATVKNVTWSTSDSTVASIDSNSGLITLERPGKCEILATTADGTAISAKCNLTVTNSVAEGLIVFPETLTLQQGEAYTMGILYVPSEADQPMIKWESSDPSVVSVDPSGTLLALSVGRSVVTASAEVNGHELSASATVSVTPLEVKGVSLSDVSVTLEKGNSTVIRASFIPAGVSADLDWSVSDPDIVEIVENEKGDAVTVTAKQSGMAILTANLPTNELICATCNITVPEIAVESIIFTDNREYFDAAEGKQIFSVKILPEDAPVPRLIWKIENPDIAELTVISPLECEFNPKENGETYVSVNHADRPDILATRKVIVSGVTSLMKLFDDHQTPVDVYDISGLIVRKNIRISEVGALKPGLYIIRQGNLTKEILIQ